MDKQITLTETQQALMYLRGILPLLAAAGAYLFLRFRKEGRFYPLLIGAVMFLLIAIPRTVSVIAAVAALESDSFLLRVLLTGIVTAVFEESARYFLHRLTMKKYDTLSDALCAGIGNACIALISCAVLQCTFYRHSVDGCLSAGLFYTDVYEVIPEGGLPAELLANTLETQGVLQALDFIFGGICLLAFHMAMSALIQITAQRTRATHFVLLAMLLHLFFHSMWAYCGTAVILPVTAAICYLVYRIRELHYRIEPDTIITIRMIFIPFDRTK